MQPVCFTEGKKIEALGRATEKDATLIAWFKLNCDNSDARIYFYHDIPNYFVFGRDHKWKRRQQGEKIIGRMYSVGLKDIERYHLRLLLSQTPGACSFDDLKKVNDEVCLTFAEAAKRRGSLCDDTEYERCLSEAALFQMPPQLRTLFCVILLYCNPESPIDL